MTTSADERTRALHAIERLEDICRSLRAQLADHDAPIGDATALTQTAVEIVATLARADAYWRASDTVDRAALPEPTTRPRRWG